MGRHRVLRHIEFAAYFACGKAFGLVADQQAKHIQSSSLRKRGKNIDRIIARHVSGVMDVYVNFKAERAQAAPVCQLSAPAPILPSQCHKGQLADLFLYFHVPRILVMGSGTESKILEVG